MGSPFCSFVERTGSPFGWPPIGVSDAGASARSSVGAAPISGMTCDVFGCVRSIASASARSLCPSVGSSNLFRSSGSTVVGSAMNCFPRCGRAGSYSYPILQVLAPSGFIGLQHRIDIFRHELLFLELRADIRTVHAFESAQSFRLLTHLFSRLHFLHSERVRR